MRCFIEDDDASAGWPAKDGGVGVGELDAACGVSVRGPWTAARAFLRSAEAGSWRSHDGRVVGELVGVEWRVSGSLDYRDVHAKDPCS